MKLVNKYWKHKDVEINLCKNGKNYEWRKISNRRNLQKCHNSRCFARKNEQLNNLEEKDSRYKGGK